MIMVAIRESLIDMELRHPQEGVQSNFDVAPKDPSSDSMQASVPGSNELSSEGAGVTVSMSSKLESSTMPVPSTIRPCTATEPSSMKGSSGNTSASAPSSVCGSSSSQHGVRRNTSHVGRTKEPVESRHGRIVTQLGP